MPADPAAAWYRWDGDTLILRVLAQPRARRDEFAGVHGDSLKIRIVAPPLEGRANQHLIQFLAAEFGVAKRQVRLARGAGGRTKQFCIRAPARLPPGLAIVSAPARR